MKLFSRALLLAARITPRGYFRILRFAASMDPALRDLNIKLRNIPMVLRADLRESVFSQLFRKGFIPHQVGLDQFLLKIIRSGDRIFDVGANVGYTAAVFSNLVGREGVVVAVEPSPRAHFLLSRSLAAVANIKLENYGVSRVNGSLTFYVPKSLDLASLEPIDGAEKVEIDVVTIDYMLEIFGAPHLIKIDVEGHEPAVLEGAARTMSSKNRPIIVFESLDATHFNHCLAILNKFSSSGYRFNRIGNDGALLSASSEEGSSDFVAIPEWANARIES